MDYKPSHKKLSYRISLRLNASEKKELERKARQAGLTISNYVRALIDTAVAYE